MSRRRALLSIGVPSGVDVTITRTSATTYLVEAVGAETKANLVFKKESDATIDDKGLQTLPYIYTHASGTKWSVDGGNGYVSAWGINIPTNGYLEANNVNDLHYNDYMELSFNAFSTGAYWQLFGKYTGGDVFPKWSVRGFGTTIGVVLYDGINSLSKQETNVTAFQWLIARLITNGNKVKLSDGVTETEYTTSVVMPGTSSLMFRIGRSDSGSPFSGAVQYYKHGTEVFAMQEGTGATTTGSEGTVLNLVGGATWIKI